MAGLKDDVFFKLSRGMRFDHRKNESAMKAFAGSRDKALPAAEDSGAAAVDELDFFQTAKSAPEPEREAPHEERQAAKSSSSSKKNKKSKSKNKNKRKEEEEEEEEQQQERQQFESAEQVRKRLRIKVRGSDAPRPMCTFELEALLPGGNLKEAPASVHHVAKLVLRNVERGNFAEPTGIQMQAVPAMLAGRDVVGIAPTGSGKTAAFLLPLIMKVCSVGRDSKAIASVVVAPTRELAAQIHREFLRLTEGKRFRSAALHKTSPDQKLQGLHLLVTTPLRLVYMLKEGQLQMSSVQLIVLDEADKLFEMGFLSQVDEILSACGDQAQRAFFSATMPPQIEELANTVLRDPLQITVGTRNAGADTIDQQLLFVGQEQGKLLAMRQLAAKGELVPPTLVFVQSKERAQELFEELAYDGVKVDAIHADRTQAQREKCVTAFRRGDVWVLICTDLMGRGIDFKGVNCVINYDFPTSAISYIHRIGRTGRASRKGKAITMFTLDDIEHLRSIANVIRLSGCEVPDWMLALKKTKRADRRKLESRPMKRARIRTISGYDKARQAKRRNIVSNSKKAKGTKRRGGDSPAAAAADDDKQV